MENLELFKQKIKEAGTIAIFSHVNPDGDTLGTSLALKIMIETFFNKKAVLIINGKIPQIYSFLPSVDDTVNNIDIDKNKIFDLAIAVDVAAKDRMSYSLPLFENSCSTINIDHHVTNSGYADLNFIKHNVSSAGEVLFEMFKSLNLPISKEIATCLYAAICSDTGNFKYENTSSQVLKIVGELAELGANPHNISYNIYGVKPKQMVMLNAYSVNNAVFAYQDKVVYTTITNDELKKFNALSEHTEGIVETLREISSVELSIFFKEINQNQTKVSMRSKTLDSTLITAKFDGGGHKFASGCTINKPLKIAVDKVLEELKKYF